MNSIELTPIGVFHGGCRKGYELPRQPAAYGDTGYIELLPHQNFEQALRDLDGFERIWVLFVFDRAQHWKPLVRPPGQDRKRGVFATRAPYRPNPIGMSCVRLVGVDGLHVMIEEADLLDGTPVLDLKPYLPYADSHPEAMAGWTAEAKRYEVDIAQHAQTQLDWLRGAEGPDLETTLKNILEKSVEPSPSNRIRGTCLSIGTWRADFRVEQSRVTVLQLRSGYTLAELVSNEDRWSDKVLHRDFLRVFEEAHEGSSEVLGVEDIFRSGMS